MSSRCEPLIHSQPAGREPGDTPPPPPPPFSHVRPDLGRPPTLCSGSRRLLGSEWPFTDKLLPSRACLTLLTHRRRPHVRLDRRGSDENLASPKQTRIPRNSPTHIPASLGKCFCCSGANIFILSSVFFFVRLQPQICFCTFILCTVQFFAAVTERLSLQCRPVILSTSLRKLELLYS